MLWGSCQVHRQHFQASFRSLTRCNFIHLALIRPIHLIHPRWATVATLAVRPKSNVIDTGIQRVRDVNAAHTMGGKGKQSARSKEKRRSAVLDVTLPPQLLAAIDTLFARNMVGEAAFSYLAGIPASAVLLDHLQDRDRARMLAVNLASTPTPHRAIRTLAVAYNLGTIFKQNAYECVAHQLSKENCWRLVLSVIKLGKRHTDHTTVRLLNWRARALIEVSHFRLLAGVLREFEDECLQPNQRTFHLLISGHIRNRNLAKAREYLTQMKEAGFPIGASTHALVVSVYRSLGPDATVRQKAFDALGQVGEREATTVLNSLIQFSLDSDDLTGALHYLSLFDIPHGLIGQSEKSSVDAHGSSPFKRIVCPDQATFTILINRMCDEHDLPRLSSIIAKMDVFGVQPDHLLVAAIIRALCAAHDVEGAVRIVARMCPSDTIPTALFRRLGLGPEKKSHVMLSISSDLSPDIHIFNALMNGVSNTLGLNGMRIVLRLMRMNKIVPNATTIEILATHLNKNENVQPRTLIRIIKGLLSRLIRPNLNHIHAITKAVMLREKVWARKKVGSKEVVLDSKRSPTLFDPIAGIELPNKLSYRSMTRPVTQSLASRDIKSDRVTIALRMKQAVAQGDLRGVEAAFCTMLERGMHANAYHYSALMQAYINTGNIATAESVFKSAIRAGVKPNATMFTILIVGRGHRKSPWTAMEAFEDMVMQGIKPDKPAIHAVANAYAVAGLHGIARRVLLDLWVHVAPFPQELRKASYSRLARAFRVLSTEDKQPEISLLSQEQRMLRWKLRRLIEVWKSPKRRARIGTRRVV